MKKQPHNFRSGDVIEHRVDGQIYTVTQIVGAGGSHVEVASVDGRRRHLIPALEVALVERPNPIEPGTLLLVTTSHPSLADHCDETGAIHPNLGRLVQPRHYPRVADTAAAGIPWAADNDCFQGLDEVAYVKMIDRLAGLPGCLFVTVPDVVGDADATLELFVKWAPELELRGLPLALVAQDGLEDRMDEIEWDRISALFIGGSTEWKEGPAAAMLAQEAARRGKWVHWGRVNTRRRFDLIVATGAASSFDGSKFARFRKTYLDDGLAWAAETAAHANRSEFSRAA